MNRSPNNQHEVAPVRKPHPDAPQERRKASNIMEYLGDLETAHPDGESDDEADNTKDEQPQPAAKVKQEDLPDADEDDAEAKKRAELSATFTEADERPQPADAKAKQEDQSDDAAAEAKKHAELSATFTEEPDEPKPVETQPDDAQKPLEEAKDLLARARQVSDALFKEARNMPEYRRVLATPKRNAQFESKLLAKAKKINARLGTHLSDNALNETVTRVGSSIASLEHSPDLQRKRQEKQAASRRRKHRGRDLQIVRGIENGESQRAVAARLGTTRWVVQHVLERDAPHLLERNKPSKLPD